MFESELRYQPRVLVYVPRHIVGLGWCFELHPLVPQKNYNPVHDEIQCNPYSRFYDDWMNRPSLKTMVYRLYNPVNGTSSWCWFLFLSSNLIQVTFSIFFIAWIQFWKVLLKYKSFLSPVFGSYLWKPISYRLIQERAKFISDNVFTIDRILIPIRMQSWISHESFIASFNHSVGT